jgi:uroporphyrinogen-III synthase
MRVLVTRPEPEAGRWAADLRARGIDAQVLPLIEIGPPPERAALDAAWATLSDLRAVMFVSGNAVRGFFSAAASTAWPDGLRAWAPGPGTAAALRQAGVPDARIDTPGADAAQFDSEHLWAQVRAQVRPADRLLVVRGVGEDGDAGRDWLQAEAAAAGAGVQTVTAYSRQEPRWSGAQSRLARDAAGDGSLWLLSSSQGVRHLLQLLPGQDWGGARALATHPRIARAARAAGFGAVAECRPAFDDVVASIESAR